MVSEFWLKVECFHIMLWDSGSPLNLLAGFLWHTSSRGRVVCCLIASQWREKSRFPTWPPVTPKVCVCAGAGGEFPLLLGGDGNFDSPCGLHWHYRCSRWTSLVTNGEESPRSLLGLLTPPQSGCWQPSLQFHEDRSLGSPLYLCWCGYGWGYSFICDVWLE